MNVTNKLQWRCYNSHLTFNFKVTSDMCQEEPFNVKEYVRLTKQLKLFSEREQIIC